MNHNMFINNETYMKFINIMCKYKNNYHMDKVVDMKKSEFVMLLKIDAHITESNTVTVSQISKEMKMTNAAASKTIGELENKGLILKKVNREDKRQAHLEITENGKERLIWIKTELDELTESIFSKFGKENTDMLLDLFEKMYQITTEEIQLHLEKRKHESEEV